MSARLDAGRLTPVRELEFLARLRAGLPRSPRQRNQHQESDAELLVLPGGGTLAVTADTLAEEIDSGLYDDPHRIGWMAVLVNASDLAAVGAEPLGILLAETLPPDLDAGFLSRLQAGIADASAAAALPVLGGDTNSGRGLAIGGTALGWLGHATPLTRRGCRAGDRLYASGALGAGSAFALLQLRARAGWTGRVPPFQPRPRIAEGIAARRFATCAMDTSDGALATLDQLARVNGLGMAIEEPAAVWLHPEAASLSEALALPAWMFLAGPHGEFELIWAVPPACEAAFCAALPAALPLGRVTPEPGVRVRRGPERITLDTGRVRNLFEESGGDPGRYLAALAQLDAAASPEAPA